MEKQNNRNIMVDGILINSYFFCKAVGIPLPSKIEDPASFMQEKIEAMQLDWSDVAAKVDARREEYKTKRREAQKQKKAQEKREEELFFARYNRVTPKNRECLRCDKSFLSKVGDRLCSECNHAINSSGVGIGYE